MNQRRRSTTRERLSISKRSDIIDDRISVVDEWKRVNEFSKMSSLRREKEKNVKICMIDEWDWKKQRWAQKLKRKREEKEEERERKRELKEVYIVLIATNVATTSVKNHAKLKTKYVKLEWATLNSIESASNRNETESRKRRDRRKSNLY